MDTKNAAGWPRPACASARKPIGEGPLELHARGEVPTTSPRAEPEETPAAIGAPRVSQRYYTRAVAAQTRSAAPRWIYTARVRADEARTEPQSDPPVECAMTAPLLIAR